MASLKTLCARACPASGRKLRWAPASFRAFSEGQKSEPTTDTGFVRRASEKLRERLRAWYDVKVLKVKAFLEDQGFNVPPNDCLPDPPYYEKLAFWRKKRTYAEHKELWMKAWQLYKDSWTSLYDKKPLGPQKSDEEKRAEMKEMVDEVRGLVKFPSTEQMAKNLKGNIEDLEEATGIKRKEVIPKAKSVRAGKEEGSWEFDDILLF
ncbi:hypothetical protein GUITHDRAFT_143146 [Guillardia theta CCMP2712]|uniref:Uncharacterized protein n=1 Tax=Guillardia theta (strain CCMP2712) TaxID=905079 RepID=L1IV62_GUITC|nr:hypothetical protein GUITHDRAFT_143146 [Guillardia theta CCMP2712]EKX39992.1 hypothetical protein GUITHDRAFT_143146 [Guillardia theta CCMP2712]|eukprot:XP_005826972.1 hypothetical protein GUITHDRAFT_143146 [Guillardia theta CCMP2712]